LKLGVVDLTRDAGATPLKALRDTFDSAEVFNLKDVGPIDPQSLPEDLQNSLHPALPRFRLADDLGGTSDPFKGSIALNTVCFWESDRHRERIP
jgi:hypothetical protein